MNTVSSFYVAHVRFRAPPLATFGIAVGYVSHELYAEAAMTLTSIKSKDTVQSTSFSVMKKRWHARRMRALRAARRAAGVAVNPTD